MKIKHGLHNKEYFFKEVTIFKYKHIAIKGIKLKRNKTFSKIKIRFSKINISQLKE
jgi:hypothetical protein